MNPSRSADPWRHGRLRKLMWGAAAALLLAPAVAMRFTAEVQWTAMDFVFMGLLLAAAGAAMEVGMRLAGDGFHRAGIACAVGGGFLLVWANAAVGLVGREGDAFNLLYLGVIGVALVGAILARLLAAGMARAMAAALAVHVAIGVAALATGRGHGVAEVAGVTGVFALPWLLAWALFRTSAKQQHVPAAEPGQVDARARRIRLQAWAATAVLAAGAGLLALMVATEGEPGALPLLIVLAGLGGLLDAWRRWRAR